MVRLRWPSAALGDSFAACVAVHQRALADAATPDVLVGSSWGGAVAAALVAVGAWRGPVVLMCPALQIRESRMGELCLADRPHLTTAAITSQLAALPAPLKAQCVLVHGTNDAGWLSIQEQGLKPMGRQHVHLAQEMRKVRAASTVHIYVKKAAVINSGLELLIASSGVILCRSTIPPTCFESAWHVTQQKELLNVEEEEWVVKEEVESNTRWKQIRLGKWTYEYTVWKYSTDEEKAWFPIPKPPDSSNYALPKRQWLKELSAWRRGLHQFRERLQAWHAEAGTEMPPLKRARGSVAQEVRYFSADPGASSSTDVTPPWRRR